MSRAHGILEYRLPGDWTLFVGTSDAANDRLSTRIAAQNDWWFHVDGVPGSHVILRAKQTEEPTRETLKQAAAIAAYHSKARNAGVVPVHCTRAKHVRKRRGHEAGTVEVSRGDSLKVRPDVSFAVRVAEAASRLDG